MRKRTRKSQHKSRRRRGGASNKTSNKTETVASNKTSNKTETVASNKTSNKTETVASNKTSNKTETVASNKTSNKTEPVAANKTSNKIKKNSWTSRTFGQVSSSFKFGRQGNHKNNPIKSSNSNSEIANNTKKIKKNSWTSRTLGRVSTPFKTDPILKEKTEAIKKLKKDCSNALIELINTKNKEKIPSAFVQMRDAYASALKAELDLAPSKVNTKLEEQQKKLEEYIASEKAASEKYKTTEETLKKMEERLKTGFPNLIEVEKAKMDLKDATQKLINSDRSGYKEDPRILYGLGRRKQELEKELATSKQETTVKELENIKQQIKTIEIKRLTRSEDQEKISAPLRSQKKLLRETYDELLKKHSNEIRLRDQLEKNIDVLKVNLVIYNSRIEKARFMVTQLVNLYAGNQKTSSVIKYFSSMVDSFSSGPTDKAAQQQQKQREFEGYARDFDGWSRSGFDISDMTSMGETIGSGISSGGELLGSAISGLFGG